MAAVRTLHLPKFPKVANGQVEALLELAVLAVESDTINYNSDSPALLFKIPRNVVILEIGINVTTAFNGTTNKIQLGDGSTADKYGSFTDILAAVGSGASACCFKNTTSTVSFYGTITATGATTGVCTIWLKYRTRANRRGFAADQNVAI